MPREMCGGIVVRLSLRVLLALSAVALPSAAQDARGIPGRPADSTVTAAPVIVGRDTVIFLTARVGAFSPQERASAVVERLRELSLRDVDSLSLVPSDAGVEVVAGDRIVVLVTDADARAAGVSRQALAAAVRDALWEELDRVSLRTTLRLVALGLLWTLLATAVLVILLRLGRRGFERLDAFLAAQREHIPALRIKTLELLSKEQLEAGIAAVVRFTRTAVVVLLLYFYLPLVLSFFPWTAPYADRLLSYVLDPLFRVLGAIVGYLPNVVFIAVIVFVTRIALTGVRAVFNAVGRGTLVLGGFERDWADPTYKIVRFLIIAFVGVVLFPYLPGADSDAFKGVSIFLGVLVSLGSSSAVANVVAGVVLTYTRAFSVGDRVRIAETQGDVITKTLLVTRIRTNKNVDITIPNAMVLGAHVLNYTAMAQTKDGLILHTTVTIGYDVPWRLVHELLIAAAATTKDVAKSPSPYVLQTALNDFAVAYEVNAFTHNAKEMARIYSDLHANIQDRFAAAGVEIMSPNYHAVRDGNPSTLPPTDRGVDGHSEKPA